MSKLILRLWHRLRWRRSALWLELADRLGLPLWVSDDALFAAALCKCREGLDRDVRPFVGSYRSTPADEAAGTYTSDSGSYKCSTPST